MGKGEGSGDMHTMFVPSLQAIYHSVGRHQFSLLTVSSRHITYIC